MKKNKLIILLLIFSPFIMGHTFKEEKATVKVGEVETPVQNVEITWESMKFTYTETVNYVWDDTNHTYEQSESTYKWNTSNNNVKISNKSIEPINIELLYLGENDDIHGTFDIQKGTVNPNEDITSKLSLDGQLLSYNTEYIKIGTIKVSLS